MSGTSHIEEQVRRARDLVQLAPIANTLQPTIQDLNNPHKKKEHEKNLDVLRVGIDRLTPNSARIVGSFAVECNYPDLRHLAMRTYMRKYGIQDLADVEVFLAVLTKEPYPENDKARTLLREIFVSAKSVFTLSEGSTPRDLVSYAEKLDMILITLAVLKVKKIDHLEMLNIFILELASSIARCICDGFPAELFFRKLRTVSFVCNIITAIAQRDLVSTKTLLAVLHAPLFESETCKMAVWQEPYIGKTYELFLQRIIDAVEQERYVLTLDQLRLMAFNIIVSPGQDDQTMRTREDFVISRVVPLLIAANEDPFAFARSFGSRISAHRFIVAFLSECTVLKDAQLESLARCIDRKELFGTEAAEKALAAKEKFALHIDVETILRSAENDSGMGLAIIIGASDGVTNSMTLEQLQGLIRTIQGLADHGDGTVH